MSDSNQQVTVTRFADVAPGDLIGKASGRTLTAALIYTPDACRVAKIAGERFDVVENGKETRADLSKAYEIRAFGRDAELRWLRAGVLGDAVLIADGAAKPAGGAESEIVDTIEQRRRGYRLWGKKAAKTAAPQGWSALSSGRVGALMIPHPVSDGGELVIEAREYIGLAAHGNAVVLFERLVGFAAAEAQGRT